MELKDTAARLRIPLAQFIRETMQDRFRQVKPRRRSAPAEHPFASIDGIADSDETDLSSRVDEILYG